MANEIRTEILVIGGGLSGCWAAIRARQLGADVVLADKGCVGRTGVSKFASTHIRCYLPEDDREDAVREIVEGGDYLNDQQWVEIVVTESLARVSEMDRFGVQFEKENGRLKRVPSKGRINASAVFHSPQMMLAMRATASRLGVSIIDRLFINDLLVKNGRVVGAAGIHAISGDFYLIYCKAVVLATGACTLRSILLGHQFSTGDAYAMAYQAGATLMNMECIKHNATARDYDTSGMGTWVGAGGRYLNARGEAFMARYHPLKDRANLTWISRAMATEVKEGRGPIYFDFSGVSEEYRKLAQKNMPWAVLALTKAGIDVTRDKIAWVPACIGSSGSAAGIKVNTRGATGVPGLLATGDAGAMVCLGAGGGFGGFNLTYCAVFGQRAGEGAVNFIQSPAKPSITSLPAATISRIREGLYAPLNRKEGTAADEVLYTIQKTFFPYEVCILKSGDRLTNALNRVREIRRAEVSRLAAADVHELVRVHETEHMALYAEMALRASLTRTESRGMHYREDYPKRDDQHWVKWTHIRNAGEDPELWSEPLPGEALGHISPI